MNAMRQAHGAKRAGVGARLWLLPLFGGAGAVAAVVLVMALRPETPRTVSEVRREIGELVLRRSDRPNASDGGAIGPWWVSAADGDAALGTFSDFQLRSGSMQIAAKSARVVIDVDLGTFSFELRDVVVMRLPSEGVPDAGMVHLDRHTLGPVALRGRVVYDALTGVTPAPVTGPRARAGDGHN